MDLLYIPQLDETSTEGEGAATRYKLLKKTAEDGRIGLEDKAVNRIDVTTSDALTIVFPAKVKGLVRDFFVRLVITADEIPEIVFTGANGEVVSFEDLEADGLTCEAGVNVFSFTETEDGVFMVNGKHLYVTVTVDFDPGEGTMEETERSYLLGAAYDSFPEAHYEGYGLDGWFTSATGGVQVAASDTVKAAVTRLYARWSVYADPFVAAICPAHNMRFYTSGHSEWTVDASVYATGVSSAKSGSLTYGQHSSLTSSVSGAGVLSFKWKVDGPSADKLMLVVDGEECANIHGSKSWADFSVTLAEGDHEIEWRYEKTTDTAWSENGNGWVDEVAWTPEA